MTQGSIWRAENDRKLVGTVTDPARTVRDRGSRRRRLRRERDPELTCRRQRIIGTSNSAIRAENDMPRGSSRLADETRARGAARRRPTRSVPNPMMSATHGTTQVRRAPGGKDGADEDQKLCRPPSLNRGDSGETDRSENTHRETHPQCESIVTQRRKRQRSAEKTT